MVTNSANNSFFTVGCVFNWAGHFWGWEKRLIVVVDLKGHEEACEGKRGFQKAKEKCLDFWIEVVGAQVPLKLENHFMGGFWESSEQTVE